MSGLGISEDECRTGLPFPYLGGVWAELVWVLSLSGRACLGSLQARAVLAGGFCRTARPFPGVWAGLRSFLNELRLWSSWYPLPRPGLPLPQLLLPISRQRGGFCFLSSVGSVKLCRNLTLGFPGFSLVFCFISFSYDLCYFLSYTLDLVVCLLTCLGGALRIPLGLTPGTGSCHPAASVSPHTWHRPCSSAVTWGAGVVSGILGFVDGSVLSAQHLFPVFREFFGRVGQESKAGPCYSPLCSTVSPHSFLFLIKIQTTNFKFFCNSVS